jgi:GAF domain-containing protein
VFVIVSLTGLHWSGTAGLALDGRGPYLLDVAAVRPGGPAAQSGLGAGDRIDLRALSASDRIRLVLGLAAGTPVTLQGERDGRSQRRIIVPATATLRLSQWVVWIILGWTAVFAGVIGWRRPDLYEARLLSLGLSSYAAGVALTLLVAPSPYVELSAQALGVDGLCGGLWLALLITFTACFGRPLSRARRVVNAVAYAFAASLPVVALVTAVALATVWFDPVRLVYGSWGALSVDGSKLLALLAGALAVWASRGAERHRLAWAVTSFGLLIAIFVFYDVLRAFAPGVLVNTSFSTASNIVGIVAPVGLTYSVLSRRVLDIGFALNRAAVFSAVSLVIVGAFVLLEHALSSWLVGIGHAEGTAIGVAGALAIGLSIRFIHTRSERVVDGVFFRKRHVQEKALLRLAAEAPLITDRRTLLTRTLEEIAEHGNAAVVAIMVRTGADEYECAAHHGPPMMNVDENDRAVLAMRNSIAVVDLRACETALRGEYALPMISRGALIGILVCGPKHDRGPYAPDELDTLGKVAYAVGMTLDLLGDGRQSVTVPDLGPSITALQAEFAQLRAEIAALTEAVRANAPAPRRVRKRT